MSKKRLWTLIAVADYLDGLEKSANQSTEQV